MLTAGASGSVPAPVTVTVCGLPGASSAIETTAFRLPRAVGVKVRVTVWLALAARVAGLLPAIKAKSVGSAPPSEIPVTFRGAVPVLVIVNDRAAPVVLITCPPKSRAAGLRLTPGAGGGVPIPLRETVAVPPAASLLIERVALRGPTAA